MNYRTLGTVVVICAAVTVLWTWGARAARLTSVSDTLSDSRPSTVSDHTLRFNASLGIPNGGSVSYQFDSGFSGFGALGVEDYDLAVDGVQRTVSADGSCAGADYADINAAATYIHVSFCGATASVSAGQQVELRIGTNAVTGGFGDSQLTNPGTTGSKAILIETFDASDVPIDSAKAIVAIVEAVGLNAVYASVTPTPAGGGGPSTPIPSLDPITFWPTYLPTMTLQLFSDSTAHEVAVLLSMSDEEFYAALFAQFTDLVDSTGQEFASVLGVSNQTLYNTMVARYPSLGSMTAAQFAAAGGSNLAAQAGVSEAEFYAALGLDIQDIATLLGVSVQKLYDFLEVALLNDLRLEPLDAPETTVTAMVTNGSGAVQLGVGGEPYSFVSDTAGNIGFSLIQGGTWLITTYAMATDAGGQTALDIQLFVLDESGNEVLMFQHNITHGLASIPTKYLTYTTQPPFAFDPGDRIIVRYLATTTGSSGPVTATVFFQGTERYSFIQTPPSIIPSACFRIADFTGDCLVNLPDLSIMMYNWPVVRNRPETDLDRDGKVYIIDFSILLYWWTGSTRMPPSYQQRAAYIAPRVTISRYFRSSALEPC